ncbi:hypothetical protein [Nostoc cycadae]|uniref:Flagellar motor protein MotB, partial n=1 Tax=Nostoc cycadae WK-1 TaxID=1861711 RepID=A0A2H6LJT6_9NOSO|nr:hypothetical protein [Nostoc cycadae]GBE93478.1 flagellar motor protein MotB [Nostoc cycadae WK-1]
MYTRQYKTKKTSTNSSDTTTSNQFAPRRFVVQPQAEEITNNQTPDLQTQSDKKKQSGNKLRNISVFPSNVTQPQPPRIQMKLTIGQPGDKYEQEADKLAADVVQRINEPESEKVQRQEIPGDEDELQMKSMVQRSVLDEFEIKSKATQADEDNFFGREQSVPNSEIPEKEQTDTLIDIPENLVPEKPGSKPYFAIKGKSTFVIDAPLSAQTQKTLQQPAKPKWDGYKYKNLLNLGEKYQDERLVNDKEDAELFGYDKPNYRPSGPSVDWADEQYVKHIQDTELQQYEITTQKNDQDETIFYWQGQPFDTSEMKNLEFSGAGERAIFVMTADGKIYVADAVAEAEKGADKQSPEAEQYDRFHHSSFLRGAPVAAAGELLFTNGILQGVTNQSGHYRPGVIHTLQVLQEFQERGVKLDQVMVQFLVQCPQDYPQGNDKILKGDLITIEVMADVALSTKANTAESLYSKLEESKAEFGLEKA